MVDEERAVGVLAGLGRVAVAARGRQPVEVVAREVEADQRPADDPLPGAAPDEADADVADPALAGVVDREPGRTPGVGFVSNGDLVDRRPHRGAKVAAAAS